MSSRAGRPDLPARELARQIRALPAPRYEFAVFDGRWVRRVWRGRQALRAVGWLKHRNGRGGRVHMRPATSACVLVEGLVAESLEAMRDDGLAPAAVLETAPRAFEAWLRLGCEPGPELGRGVEQVLAARYGAVPAEAGVRRLGRAAGFLNRSAALAGADGRYPRVLLVEARGRVTPKAEELVAAAAERLSRRRADGAARLGGAGNGRAADPQAFLAREVERIARRHGKATDRPRAFAAAARGMALAGFTEAEVAAALAASPEVRPRKAGGCGDHAARIAAWAFGTLRRRPR